MSNECVSDKSAVVVVEQNEQKIDQLCRAVTAFALRHGMAIPTLRIIETAGGLEKEVMAVLENGFASVLFILSGNLEKFPGQLNKDVDGNRVLKILRGVREEIAKSGRLVIAVDHSFAGQLIGADARLSRFSDYNSDLDGILARAFGLVQQ